MSNFFIKPINAVFIHIPKTGGTSIRKGTFRDVEGPEIGTMPDAWEQYFKFAFVREPIDRFLSCVAMFRSGTVDEDGRPRIAGNPQFTLEYAIEILSMRNLDSGVNRKSLEERFLHHALPMTHPQNMLISADYVGRYENLEESFAEIIRHCGIRNIPKLPKLHRSRAPIRKEVLQSNSLQLLAEYYAEDFRFCGYDFP
jgi:hypothetical protein